MDFAVNDHGVTRTSSEGECVGSSVWRSFVNDPAQSFSIWAREACAHGGADILSPRSQRLVVLRMSVLVVTVKGDPQLSIGMLCTVALRQTSIELDVSCHDWQKFHVADKGDCVG